MFELIIFKYNQHSAFDSYYAYHNISLYFVLYINNGMEIVSDQFYTLK